MVTAGSIAKQLQNLVFQKPNKANLSKMTGFSGSKIKPFLVIRDRLKIRGYAFIHPEEKRPTIIISHELGANQVTSARWVTPQYKAGYNVYIFDFAGGGNVSISDGKTTDMSIQTEEADLNVVLNYVKSIKSTDTNHLVLEGNSQGGIVAALIAAKRPNDVNKLILNYPGFSIPDMCQSGKGLPQGSLDPKNPPATLKIKNVLIVVGRKYITDAQKINTWKTVKNFKKPVILTYGTSDSVISQPTFHKIEQTYSDIKSVPIKGTGFQHAFPNPNDFAAAQKADVNFLRS